MDARNAMRDGRKGDADGDAARLKEKELAASRAMLSLRCEVWVTKEKHWSGNEG